MKAVRHYPDIPDSELAPVAGRWNDRQGTTAWARDDDRTRKACFVMGWELDDLATPEGERQRGLSSGVRGA